MNTNTDTPEQLRERIKTQEALLAYHSEGLRESKEKLETLKSQLEQVPAPGDYLLEALLPGISSLGEPTKVLIKFYKTGSKPWYRIREEPYGGSLGWVLSQWTKRNPTAAILRIILCA